MTNDVQLIETSLVDAKYGRLHLEAEKVPASATLDMADVDEPVFILRAQDDLAMATVVRYANMANQIEDPAKRPSDEWYQGLDAVIASFGEWRSAQADKIKIPD